MIMPFGKTLPGIISDFVDCSSRELHPCLEFAAGINKPPWFYDVVFVAQAIIHQITFFAQVPCKMNFPAFREHAGRKKTL